MTATLDVDLLPLVEAMFELLKTEPDVVKQQQTLELLVFKQAMRMGNTKHARIVIDGIHKHVMQIIMQTERSRQ
jgi:hypothetical protein